MFSNSFQKKSKISKDDMSSTSPQRVLNISGNQKKKVRIYLKIMTYKNLFLNWWKFVKLLNTNKLL